MASNQIGQCCAVGVKHEGEPTGKLETLEGVTTYVARPGSNAKSGVAILFLTDVFGYKFPNNQLLADDYARNGYLTIVPNIIHDDPVPAERPEGFDIMKWFAGEAPHGKEPHGPETVFPIVDKSISWLKSQGINKIGAVGYCYGAKHSIVKLGKKEVDVVYVAHPSFVEESELEAIKGPLSIAAAETDSIFPAEKRHKSEEILQKTGQPYQITLYSGVEHGFSVRGDMKNPAVKFGKEQAFFQAIQWFDQWLK